MKKLIPMMAAVACAFGAFAESTGHKETFNDLPLGPLELNVDQGYWQGAEGVEASVVDGTAAGRASQILDITDSSVTSPLYFNYNKVGSDGSGISKRQEIGDGVYLDTMVQFTVSSDLNQQVGADAKLAVWAYSNEDDEAAETKTTNLVMRAGYYNNGTLETKTYTTDKAINDKDWYRLTIKAMPIYKVGSDTYFGFVVYVDKEPVAVKEAVKSGESEITYFAAAKKYADANQLLPSAVPGSDTSSDTVMGCGFAGTGKIDDIELTDVAPEFAKDDFAMVVTKGDHVATVTVTVGGVEITGEDGVYTLPAGTTQVTIAATAEDGYMITAGTGTIDVAKTVEVTAAKIAATVDGENYSSLADAVAKAVGSGAKLVLAADVTEQIALRKEGSLTIDLAGKTIAAVEGDYTISVEGVSLTIEDSSELKTGVINASEGFSAIYASALTIAGGKIAGAIENDAETIVFNGGKILNNEYNANTFTVPEGKKAVLGEDGYWTVKDDDPTPPTKYTVSIAEGIENGKVVADVGEVEAGTTVTLTVTPVTGYQIAKVTTNGVELVAVEGAYTFVMPAEAVEVSATFELIPPTKYTVSIAEGIVNGTVVANVEEAEAGTTVTLTVTPATGYQIATVTTNGVELAAVKGAYTFVMPAEAVVVSATFTAKQRPTVVNGGSAEQIKDYDTWAKKNGVEGQTDAALADAFALGVAPDQAQTAVNNEVPNIDMTKIATDLTAAVAAIQAKYPYATVTLKPYELKGSDATLFQLSISFAPANAN